MNRIFSLLIFYFSICSFSAQSFLPTSNASVDEASLGSGQSTVNKPTTANDKLAINSLNQLFNSDESNKNRVLIINNDSDCDFTMMISGHKSYVVPVASRKSESIIVEQGEYVLRSEICQSPYLSKKILTDNMQVNIKFTTVTTPQTPSLTTNK